MISISFAHLKLELLLEVAYCITTHQWHTLWKIQLSQLGVEAYGVILNESTTECNVLCSSQALLQQRKIEERVLDIMCGEFKVDLLHCVYAICMICTHRS